MVPVEVMADCLVVAAVAAGFRRTAPEEPEETADKAL
jgi:hypothetical protein